jgi:hypothetical protein
MAVEKPPASIRPQTSWAIGTNWSQWPRSVFSRSVKGCSSARSLSMRPTFSAKNVNRQRMRNAATTSAWWPADSKLLASLASLSAISRVTLALWRVGSSPSGSLQARARSKWVSSFARSFRVIGLAEPGKVGIQLDHVADVHHEDERRVAFLGRERADIPFGFALGTLHRRMPPSRAADGGPAPAALGSEEQLIGAGPQYSVASSVAMTTFRWHLSLDGGSE